MHASTYKLVNQWAWQTRDLLEIAILRHGEPEATSTKLISAARFSEWIDQYNSRGVSKSSYASTTSTDYAQGCRVIVSSNLLRSIQSAETLCINQQLLSDELYSEAGIPYAEWHWPELSPGVWAIIFRVLWFLGYSRNSETMAETRKRAAAAAKQLGDLASVHGSVLYVGHGIFNRFLAKELKKLGWDGPKSPGSEYWALSIYSNSTVVGERKDTHGDRAT